MKMISGTEETPGVEEVKIKDLFPKQHLESYLANGGTPHLDYVHTVFGQVVSGMEVVDKIAKVKVDDQGKPEKPVKIKKITIIEVK